MKNLNESFSQYAKRKMLSEAKSKIEYGDGKTTFRPTGADGQWPGKYDQICNAILNNNVNKLKSMMYNGVYDLDDPEETIDFNDQYTMEFGEDYSLVFKGGWIGDALNFMLNYDGEFFVAPFDILNLVHAGKKACNKNTLLEIIDNYIYNTGNGDEEAEEGYTWNDIQKIVEEGNAQ